MTLSVPIWFHFLQFEVYIGKILSEGGRMRPWVVRVFSDCFTPVGTQVLFPDLQYPRGDSPYTVLNAVYFYSNWNVSFVVLYIQGDIRYIWRTQIPRHKNVEHTRDFEGPAKKTYHCSVLSGIRECGENREFLREIVREILACPI